MTELYAVEAAWSTVERPMFVRVSRKVHEHLQAELLESGGRDWTNFVDKSGVQVLIRIDPAWHSDDGPQPIYRAAGRSDSGRHVVQVDLGARLESLTGKEADRSRWAGPAAVGDTRQEESP